MKNQVIINDINLSYFELGKGKTLIYFHGGRLKASTHQNILFKLSKKYHVIAPDIPGYGSSSTPKELWTFRDYALFFDKFLEKKNIKKAIVVGYSLGGGIAYNLANITPRVSRLVLIDSAGIEKTKDLEFLRDFKRLLFYFLNLKYFSTFFVLLKEYCLFNLKHLRDFFHMKNIRNNLNKSVGYIKNLKTPMSIIWAKNDEIFPVSIAKKLKKLSKNSKLFLINANHDWILYKEDKCIDTLNKALK